jgi:hypothetical protein
MGVGHGITRTGEAIKGNRNVEAGKERGKESQRQPDFDAGRVNTGC